MKMFLVLASVLALCLIVVKGSLDCFDKNTNDILKHYKTDKELTPLLKGHTFVDLWKGKDVLVCSPIEYTADGDDLIVTTPNVGLTGNRFISKMKEEENKGESSFNLNKMETHDINTLTTNGYVHVFYADELVICQFSCDYNYKFLTMSILIRKDKESDSQAAESIRNAEDIMTKLKGELRKYKYDLAIIDSDANCDLGKFKILIQRGKEKIAQLNRH